MGTVFGPVAVAWEIRAQALVPLPMSEQRAAE
jgi:hypothetical protein